MGYELAAWVMPSGFCIRALDAYASLYQKMGTIPVSWDIQKKKFVYKVNHKELLFWYFTMSVVLFGTLCCCFICLREIFVKVTNVSAYVLVIQMFFGLLGVAGCGSNLLVLIYGKIGTTAWDNICFIENIVTKGN